MKQRVIKSKIKKLFMKLLIEDKIKKCKVGFIGLKKSYFLELIENNKCNISVNHCNMVLIDTKKTLYIVSNKRKNQNIKALETKINIEIVNKIATKGTEKRRFKIGGLVEIKSFQDMYSASAHHVGLVDSIKSIDGDEIRLDHYAYDIFGKENLFPTSQREQYIKRKKQELTFEP